MTDYTNAKDLPTVTGTQPAVPRESFTQRWTRYLRQWRYSRRVAFCKQHGHRAGPVLIGPRYAAKHRHYFDVLMLCPHCGTRGTILTGVPYRWKAHRDLHNLAQSVWGKINAGARR
jgi:hypothetical protein